MKIKHGRWKSIAFNSNKIKFIENFCYLSNQRMYHLDILHDYYTMLASNERISLLQYEDTGPPVTEKLTVQLLLSSPHHPMYYDLGVPQQCIGECNRRTIKYLPNLSTLDIQDNIFNRGKLIQNPSTFWILLFHSNCRAL